jgi:hypothetical protein
LSRNILKNKVDAFHNLFQSGELSLHDFHFIVAHPDILPELVSVRGLMKRKFPNQKSGMWTQEVVSYSVKSSYNQVNVISFAENRIVLKGLSSFKHRDVLGIMLN